MLEELTKALKALNNKNLKEMYITDGDDVVVITTRRGRTIEIDIKGLNKKEAIKKVVNIFKK